jgi:hypothetical protein
LQIDDVVIIVDEPPQGTPGHWPRS